MKPNENLKRLIKFRAAYAIVLLLSVGLTCCDPIDVDVPEDGYMGLLPPRQTAIGEKDNEVTWSCIEFGAYPTNEVVDGSFDAVDAYAVREGDVIRDATLYKKLSEAIWTGDETEIDGHRYFRINGAGAVSAAGDREQHYRWDDTAAWHYFEFAPMKWRVLELSGSQALLIADRMPDVCPFHEEAVDVSWEQSGLRRWLNGEFLERAFSAEEQAAIPTVEVENAPNYYFGTSSGPTTHDKVFILSENEIFASTAAESYGFYPGDELNDKARRFSATMYAKCRGAWWSSVEAYRGNSFWMMRTSGYTKASAAYVCDFGYLYVRGTSVTCDDAAVLPAITVDLEKAKYQLAGEVLSTDIIKKN